MKFKLIAQALLVAFIGFSTTAPIEANAETKPKATPKKVTAKKIKAKKTVKKVSAKKTLKKSKKAIIKKQGRAIKKYRVTKKRYRVAAPASRYAPSNIKYSVFNYRDGTVLEESSSNIVWPIASLTKLMTAYVFVTNTPDLKSCTTAITEEDTDITKGTRTKLGKHKPYSCENLLEVMLLASDNYAASALARSVPGWSKSDFVRKMNQQARQWGLTSTTFVDSSGLSPNNRSSVEDYRKLAINVVKNDYISKVSSEHTTTSSNKWSRQITYKNSNKLVREYGFNVNLSKTGYIRESGYNLVHLAKCSNPIGVVEFGARSSDQRAYFVKQKLAKYGCN